MPGGFKRINYSGTEEIFETKVQDGTGREIGKWKVMKSDFGKALRFMNKKFGLNLVIREKRQEQREKDFDDLSWAR